jgi:long-chain fatty acid transport protein
MLAARVCFESQRALTLAGALCRAQRKPGCVPGGETGSQARIIRRGLGEGHEVGKRRRMIDASRSGSHARLLAIAIIAVALTALTRPAAAGGFFLYELGTPDVGLASAGYAARAQDASTLFTNPAGMMMLDNSQILAGVQPIYTHMVFSPDAANTTTGTDGGNALVPLPGASFFFVYNLSNRVKLGFGSFTYFGGAIEYNLNWVGRYFLQGATILGTSFMPAVAFRVTDWLSVGVGLNVMLGFLREKAAVRNLLPGNDGQIKYQDYTAGVGGDVGFLFHPDEKTRIGVTYLSPVELNFSAVPHFKGIGPGVITLLNRGGIFGASVDLGITVPQEVMVSVYREVTDRLALMGNVNWQNWTQFGLVGIAVNSANPKSLTTDFSYEDTWGIAAGGQFKVTPELMLSAGFAFDSSMVSDSDRTVSAPVGDQYRYAAGAQYRWNEHLTTGFSYELMWQGSLPLSQTRGLTNTTTSGEFTNTLINFFAVSLGYGF